MEDRKDILWRIAEGNIMTRWAEQVDPEGVLPEYPRPQMQRSDWMNLNGLWDYSVKAAEDKKLPDDYDGKILVPFPIESALSGVKRLLLPDEILWYRRTFKVPENWRGRNLLLHFGAVDWKAEVWINGKKAGEHTGGYFPFTFEISRYIIDGENEITVSVWDPTDTYGQERGKQSLKPNGIFYTPSSGIWQTVWIEPVPINYIKSFRLIPDIDNSEISIIIETDGENENLELQAEAYENNNKISYGKTTVINSLKLKIPSPRLWSLTSPFLYDVTIQLMEDDKVIDEIISYFGMRKFSIESDKEGVKRLLLNNQPIFQNGILDQGFWPDGLYTAPADQALEYDVKMAKELGFNMIRKHIKAEPARWYYHCDKLGMIVWQDMINGGAPFNTFRNAVIPNILQNLKVKDNNYKASGRYEKANRDNYKKELKEMIDTLYNVPSIGMWVPFNEGWGQFDAEEIYEWIKKYDKTRWVDHASGWYDQGIGDIKSVHIYFRKLKKPKVINSRAAVISEYGGYSLPVKGHVWNENKEFGYKKFKKKEELKEAYSSLMNDQVKPLMEKGISAAVYTQLTDVETEVNGLMTYDREIVKIL
ncbi:MAG: beta-galactosidase [Bacillota bacterium]|nr:beta-galactosidase [Bacillota bacterium]